MIKSFKDYTGSIDIFIILIPYGIWNNGRNNYHFSVLNWISNHANGDQAYMDIKFRMKYLTNTESIQSKKYLHNHG